MDKHKAETEAKAAARRVAEATRDGILFEIVSHCVLAVTGVGIAHAVGAAFHIVAGWVA